MGAPRRRRAPGCFGLIAVIIAVLIALAIFARVTRHLESVPAALTAGRVGCGQVTSAFRHHTTGQWLTMRATTSRILPDSHGVSTHQRVILRCPTGQTVLVDNNVDVGQRAPVRPGQMVIVHGQYIWNSLGGLIHDTHRSTDANPNGWVLVARKIYQ